MVPIGERLVRDTADSVSYLFEIQGRVETKYDYPDHDGNHHPNGEIVH
jgi:hypothetical protein